MKKYIEITETNHNRDLVLSPTPFKTPGFYVNTDETGTVTLIFVVSKELDPHAPNSLIFFDFTPPQIPQFIKTMAPPDEVKQDKTRFTGHRNPPPPPQQFTGMDPGPGEAISALTSFEMGIDDVLKIIAVARRPELILNIVDQAPQNYERKQLVTS